MLGGLISIPVTKPPLPEPPVKALTNRERLEIIQGLKKEPFKAEEVWFFILLSWFRGWESACKQEPDSTDIQYPCLDTAPIKRDSIRSGPKKSYSFDSQWVDGWSESMIVSHAVWSRLSDW